MHYFVFHGMSWNKKILDAKILGVATIKKWDSIVFDKTKLEFILEKNLREGKLVVEGDYFWKVTLHRGDARTVLCESGLSKSNEYLVGLINVIVATQADDSALTLEELQESLYICEDDYWNQYMTKEIEEADLSSISWASIWPNPNDYRVKPTPCWGKYNFSIGWTRMSGWHVDITQGAYGVTERCKSLKECVEYAKKRCSEASLPLK